MNGKQIVLQHFTKYKYISSKQAFELYGITRLSAVIFDLREEGYNIGSVWRSCTNRYGNNVRYMDYFLIKGKKKWFSRKQ